MSADYSDEVTPAHNEAINAFVASKGHDVRPAVILSSWDDYVNDSIPEEAVRLCKQARKEIAAERSLYAQCALVPPVDHDLEAFRLQSDSLRHRMAKAIELLSTIQAAGVLEAHGHDDLNECLEEAIAALVGRKD